VQRSFLTLFAVVSALGAIALALVVEGAQGAGTAAIAGGALLAIPALAGVVALGRIVVNSERQRGRR
jgi:hypothetical protein